MSLINQAKKISETDGIEAVVVWKPSARVELDTMKWFDLLAGAIDLLGLTDTKVPYIRLHTGRHTLVAQREGEEIIAVVFPTGHEVVKGLRRMIRRAAKRGSQS